MIPAKTTCPMNWTREYYGYLMSEHVSFYRRQFICVDKDQSSIDIPGVEVDRNGALVFHVEATCNGQLPCPPYDTEKEFNCVVCTN